MNRAASSRAGRVPLGSRHANVEANNHNHAGGKSTIHPSKKDSRSHLQRMPSGSSSVMSGASSVVSSTTTGTNNRAFDSMNSDMLRKAIHSASESSGVAAKKQPLGASKHPNQRNQQPRSGAPAKPSKSSSSSSEPVTIVEHRKRPCGDGHTVHKYLRGKLLGKGGFAKVYKVTSLDTNKEYAVKIVPKANLVKSRARQKVSFPLFGSLAAL